MNELRPTAVVIDSTTYLPREVIEGHGLSEVSLYVILDGEQRRELEVTDYPAFYAQLKASSGGATTSQPSVGDFLDVWKPLLEGGQEVVSIHIASGISGTHETAVSAREQLIEEGFDGERLHLVDSSSGAGGTALCVLAAIAEAERGGDGAAVVAKFAAARAGLEIRFAVDNLEYLRRGGRIGAAQALLGTALKIKPILAFESEVVVVDKVRTRSRALQHLYDFAAERAAISPQVWCVQHVDDPDTAAMLVERCRDGFGRDPAFVTEIGPVCGAHTGPGLVGVGSIPAATLL